MTSAEAEAEEAAVAPAPKGDEASPPAAAGEPEEGGPLSYKVSQGVLFIKRSKDPRSRKIVRVARPLGAVVHSTGRTWTGPGGGRWAEVDLARQGERGWALLEGAGFGIAGPALVDAALELITLQVYLLGSPEQPSGVVYEALASPEASVAQVKSALSVARGLQPDFCFVSKELPAFAPNKSGQRLSADYMQEAKDHQTLSAMGFTPTRLATLLLVYTGDLPASLACRPAPLPRR